MVASTIRIDSTLVAAIVGFADTDDASLIADETSYYDDAGFALSVANWCDEQGMAVRILDLPTALSEAARLRDELGEARNQCAALRLRQHELTHELGEVKRAAAPDYSVTATMRARINELLAERDALLARPVVTTPTAKPTVKRAAKVTGGSVPWTVALRLVKGSVEARSSMPILGCAMITGEAGYAVITTTDRTTSMSVTTATPWPTGEVRCIDLGALAKAKGEPVPAPDHKVMVGGMLLTGYDPAEWPAAPEVGPTYSPDCTFGAAELREALRRTFASVAPEDNRYGLNGLNIEHSPEGRGATRFVSTDGNRLATAVVPGVEWRMPRQMLLPRTAVEALLPVLLNQVEGGTAHVSTYERMVSLTVGPVRMTSRLLEADFPDYRQVIPSEFGRTVTVDRDQLVAAVKRVAVLATDAARTVRFTFGVDGVTLYTRKLDVGEMSETVPCEMVGGPLTTGFNARFILDALDVVPAGPVTFSMRAGPTTREERGEKITTDDGVLAPCRIATAGDHESGYCIVMPVRL